MRQYFSWSDLKYRWNKEDFELLELIRQGLQPYSKYGNPINMIDLVENIPDNIEADLTEKTWNEMPWPLNDTIAECFIDALSSAIFRRENVLNIETETDLWKLTRPTLVWLNGHDLMERWSIDEFSLCKMIVEYGLPAYDAQTLRSVQSGSTGRNELGVLITGTNDQKFEAMNRLRFKPFEVDEFESDNSELLQTTHDSNAPDVGTLSHFHDEGSPKEVGDYYFRNEGDIWEITFHDESAFFKTSKGLQHIAYLIENMGIKIPCRVIYDEREILNREFGIEYDIPLTPEEKAPLIQIADTKCKKFNAYRDKPDSEEKSEATEDWRKTRNHLFDYGIKVRCTKSGIKYDVIGKPSDQEEKARTNVTNNIKNSIKMIEGRMPKLAEHLNEELKTGFKCVYSENSSTPIQWKIEREK